MVPQRNRIARQLLEALSYLHAQEPRVVHGDVKPHNALLAEDGSVRLADFGLASVARIAQVSYSTHSQAGGPAAGTPMYMPPELFDDNADVAALHPAQDLYAWAATCIELYSGEKPWKKLLPQQILAQLMRQRSPEVPAAVPGRLKELLQACLQADPMKRPTAAEALERFPPIAAADDAPPLHCCVCMETFDAGGSGLCCSRGHFVCDTDSLGLIEHALEPARLRKHEGCIQCPFADPPCKETFTHADIDRLGNRKAVQRYMAGMQAFVATLVQAAAAPVPAVAQPKAAADAAEQQDEQAVVRRHRLHLAEELLPLRCPSCRIVFLDYDGCDALTCERCGSGFCALCLELCGRDAHAHVFQRHGQVYGGQVNFEATHQRRRQRLVEAWLATIQPPRLQAAVLEACWRDLQEVGVRIQAPADVAVAQQRALNDQARALVEERRQVDELTRRFHDLRTREGALAQENERLQQRLQREQRDRQRAEERAQAAHSSAAAAAASAASAASSSREYFNGHYYQGDPNSAAGRVIHTGPRGGRYYINGNGNKVYV